MPSALTTLISAAQLHAEINNPDFLVIDCRFSLADTEQGEAAYAVSRIPGAQYAHLDRDLSGDIVEGLTGRHPLPEKEVLAARFRQLGVSNHSQIVVYDDKAGAIASRFWWLSRWLGHSACAVLDGGFSAWQRAAYPLQSNTPKRCEPGNFEPKQALFNTVDKQRVLDETNYLIDAREAERYKGEHEPIDPVAGHIPGAVNKPFMENLNTDGTFKSKAMLQQRFDSVIAEAASRTLVHYCGSGVTAAHNMLAMCIAERNPGSLFAGSFSEWITGSGEQFPVVRQDD